MPIHPFSHFLGFCPTPQTIVGKSVQRLAVAVGGSGRIRFGGVTSQLVHVLAMKDFKDMIALVTFINSLKLTVEFIMVLDMIIEIPMS